MLRCNLVVSLTASLNVLLAVQSAVAQSDCYAEDRALTEKFTAASDGISKVSELGMSDRPDYAKVACQAARALVADTTALKRLAAGARCKNNRSEFTKHADDFADSGRRFVTLYCK